MKWTGKLVLLMGMLFLLTACQKREDQLEVTTTQAAATEESKFAEEELKETGEVKTETVESEIIEEVETEVETETETVTESETEEPSIDEQEILSFDTAKEMFATAAVNVRRGPGTQYAVISHLATGQKVLVYGQAGNGWYQTKVGEEMGYTSNHYLGEEAVINQAPEAVTNEQSKQVTVAPAGVIMVGDSRCVQMQEAVAGGGCSWICENGKEYNWFKEKAIPRIDEAVGNGTKVVINMGVNDPEHYQQYVELVNAKAGEWANKGAITYFVSVNPVWENPYTTAEQVETFNANVPGMLSNVHWIDTCSWLNENGYKILDGLHYDADTYKNIFSVIMGSI